ncbi:hypothetical protein [Shinella sp.]|uniref:hypothetical protein n=1 Tax=Shinella sp. TaxID=1870904 RepID=UPI003F6FB650
MDDIFCCLVGRRIGKGNIGPFPCKPPNDGRPDSTRTARNEGDLAFEFHDDDSFYTDRLKNVCGLAASVKYFIPIG